MAEYVILMDSGGDALASTSTVDVNPISDIPKDNNEIEEGEVTTKEGPMSIEDELDEEDVDVDKDMAEEIRHALDTMVDLIIGKESEEEDLVVINTSEESQNDVIMEEETSTTRNDKNNPSVQEDKSELPAVEATTVPDTGKVIQKSKKRKMKETWFERMKKKAKIIEDEVIINHFRCRICFMSASTESALFAHFKLVHNLRFGTGPPKFQQYSLSDDDEEVEGEVGNTQTTRDNSNWQDKLSNLNQVLLEAETAPPYSEEERREFLKEIAKSRKPVNRYYRCDLCYIDFKAPVELEVHTAHHEQNKILNCSHCNMGFIVEYSLKKHQEMDEKDNMKSPTEEKAKHICPKKDCVESFKNRKCLLFHLTRHDGLHRCHVCAKTFDYSDQVIEHFTEEHIMKRNKPVSVSVVAADPQMDEDKEPVEVADPESDLDEAVAAPDSEKSDLSTDDDNEESMPAYVDDEDFLQDDGIIDNGTNKPPYRCTQCGTQYTQIGNLNRHEKLRHSKITVFDEHKRRILVPNRGNPFDRYRRRRIGGRGRRRGGGRGGRRGATSSSRGFRNPRRPFGNRPSLVKSQEKESPVETKSESSSLTPSPPSSIDNSISPPKDTTTSEESVSSGSGKRRLTRSSFARNQGGSSLISVDPVIKSEVKQDVLNEDNSDGEGKREWKCFQCPKVMGAMNILTRHLKSDHGTDALTVKAYCMMLGSYRCLYCNVGVNNNIEGREAKLRHLRTHMEIKHPGSYFPSNEELEEMQNEIKTGVQIQDDSRQKSKLKLKRLVITVNKLEPEVENPKLDGNSFIFNSSEEKFDASDLINQTSLVQNIGSVYGESESEILRGRRSKEPSEIPSTSDPNVESICAAPAVVVESSNVHSTLNQDNSQEESIPLNHKILDQPESKELSFDDEPSPEFRDASPAILQMDIFSESIELKSETHTTEEEHKQSMSCSITTNTDASEFNPTILNNSSTKEEPCSSLPSGKKSLIFNVPIPQLKLSSSKIEKRANSTESFVESHARSTLVKEDTANSSQEKVVTPEDKVILEKINKTEQSEEDSSKSLSTSKKSISSSPKKRKTLNVGKPVSVKIIPDALTVTYDKPLSSLTPYSIQPEMLIIPNQAFTTPTPVKINRIVLPGDPETSSSSSVISIQPTGSPRNLPNSEPRLKLISHDKRARLYRCSICEIIFSDKRLMDIHVKQVHKLNSFDSADTS